MAPSLASAPRIALLDASHTVETTRRNFRRELDAELAEFHCADGNLPSGFDYDGVVISGSGASVYWEREWIHRLRHWVQGAIERGLPALGVCFGHQLLAEAMGGRVEDMGEYEIGYRTVEHTGQKGLFANIPESMTVFTTHSDRVAALPPGGTALATNDYGLQAFRKDRVHGVQFHPEYDPETARMITRGKDDQLSDARIQEVLRGIHTGHYKAACRAKPLFDNFLAYVDTLSAQRVTAG
jgi:GMP synthase (glutamine-hydrolysing)